MLKLTKKMEEKITEYTVDYKDMEYVITINEHNEVWITPSDGNDNSMIILKQRLNEYHSYEIDKAIELFIKGEERKIIDNETIKKFIIQNCTDESGDIHINGLDFSDFKGNIYISNLKIKGNLDITDFYTQGNVKVLEIK